MAVVSRRWTMESVTTADHRTRVHGRWALTPNGRYHLWRSEEDEEDKEDKDYSKKRAKGSTEYNVYACIRNTYYVSGVLRSLCECRAVLVSSPSQHPRCLTIMVASGQSYLTRVRPRVACFRGVTRYDVQCASTQVRPMML